MTVLSCPLENCSFQTDDVEAVGAAAILNIHYLAHATPSTNVPPTLAHAGEIQRVPDAKGEKVKRPIVTSGGTSQDWKYFETRWSDYKIATKITGTDVKVHLLECCDEQLRKDLTRSMGCSPLLKSETEILASMKLLAVREENIMVARATLNAMRQDRDEPVRSFGAKARGQADICKFVEKCPSCNHEVSYTNSMLRDVICIGINDPDIQLELFSNIKQDMTLEEIYRFVETKEAGKRSASHFHSQQTAAAMSSYKKLKQGNREGVDKQPKTCGYCGQTGHGVNPTGKVRERVCPAYNHTCTNCNTRHHFEQVCRKKKRAAGATGNTDVSGALFQTLCSITSYCLNHQSEDTNNTARPSRL